MRGKAKGEILELKYTCPKCNGQIPLAINIDDNWDYKDQVNLDEDQLQIFQKKEDRAK